MRKSIYILTALCLTLLQSCIKESGYDDNYYIKNKLDRDVKVIRHDMNNISYSFIVKSDETILYASPAGFGNSPFDSDINTICMTHNTFIFNDSVCIIHKPHDSISKNPCMTHSWEIIKEEHKRNLGSHDVLYTITEEDYQNAISQGI